MAFNRELHIPLCWDLEDYGWGVGYWFPDAEPTEHEAELKTSWSFGADLTHHDPTPVTIEDYTRLVPWQHRRPKFLALLRTVVSPLVDLQNAEANMSRYFDVDGAVGKQLDQVGEWAGISRIVENVVLDGKIGAVVMPDYIYRSFIKAKIAANSWDGTKEKISEAWRTAFGDMSRIAVIDNQDMSMKVIMTGIDVDEVFMEMLKQGLLPLRPSGVMISYVIGDPASNRIFTWDMDTPIFGGWDDAAWLTGEEVQI